MAKFRTQYSDPVKMPSIDNSNLHHETIPGQAKTGSQLWTMRNAGLPLNATINFNDVDPRADFFDNLDAMQSFMLRHGLYSNIDASSVEKSEEQSPAEVPVSE